MNGAREAALRALTAFRRSRTWPQDALDDAIRRVGLDGRDAALSQKICRGVLRNMAFLDWHLARIASRPCGKIEPRILDILRISAYQILFLDRVPVRSAVDEGVELAKRSGQAAAGFVNAVLRRLAAERDALPEIKCDTLPQTLSTRWSHPEWLVEELLSRLGETECVRLLKADAEEPELTLQRNPLKADTKTVLQALTPFKARPHAWQPDAYVISGVGKLTELEPVRDGLVWVQDAAARAAVSAAGPRPGMFVLDVCAAPGGKSFAAASEMMNRGAILACDLAEKKLFRIREGAGRLGITILRTEARDATLEWKDTSGKADLVIADVPCSGFGTLRKNPDVRYKQREDVMHLPEVQSRILEKASEAVKPGGVLLYSTCTVRSDENENIVEDFLRMHEEFHLEPYSVPGVDAPRGFLTFWPHVHGTDGFFAAKLRRND